jgi:hypothetical protein
VIVAALFCGSGVGVSGLPNYLILLFLFLFLALATAITITLTVRVRIHLVGTHTSTRAV